MNLVEKNFLTYAKKKLGINPAATGYELLVKLEEMSNDSSLPFNSRDLARNAKSFVAADIEEQLEYLADIVDDIDD